MKKKSAQIKQFTAPRSALGMTCAIAGGFFLMLVVSLFMYRIESKYIRALEIRIASEQGRVSELEKLLRIKEEEVRVLKNQI